MRGAAVVESNEGEFLMVERMISNKSRVVRSLLVVVSSIIGADVMEVDGVVTSVVTS